MAAYAIAHLRDPKPIPEIFEYLERIDSTLEPYRGRFIIHGTTAEVLEGAWPGAVVAIEFPTVADAKGWYESSDYQKILHLRANHIRSDVILVEGVEAGHNSAQMAARLREETTTTIAGTP